MGPGSERPQVELVGGVKAIQKYRALGFRVLAVGVKGFRAN